MLNPTSINLHIYIHLKHFSNYIVADESLDSIKDLYKNAHRIKHFKRGNNTTSSDDTDEDDDDSDLNEEERGNLFAFFCNHFQR